MKIRKDQRKWEYKREKYPMGIHFTPCCGKEKRMLLISFGVEMESCPDTLWRTYASTGKKQFCVDILENGCSTQGKSTLNL